MKNAINWFEIPVKDYKRAKQFYTTVLDTEITDYPMPKQKISYGVFAYSNENKSVGGAIIEGEDQNPSMDGCTIYLNGGEDLSTSLSRVETAGGKIIMPKTNIGENGFVAQFIDTEGNRIALHSMQ